MKKFLYLLLALSSLSGAAYSDLTWTSPQQISIASNNSSARVVVDSSGNATAAWVDLDGTTGPRIVASHLPLAGSWSSPPTQISSTTASKPSLGVQSNGDVTAIWLEGSTVNTSVYSGGTWSSAVAISGSGASTPVLAVDAAGNAIAAWVRGTFIESATRVSGTWSLVAQVSAAASDNPSVSISSFGTALLGWHTVSSGSDLIVTNTVTVATNTWGTNKNVFGLSSLVKHNYPKVALDSKGNAAVAWFRYNLVDGTAFVNVQVAASLLNQGATSWQFLSLLSQAGIRNPADLTIKLRYDTSGDAFIVWTNSYDGQTFVVENSERMYGAAAWREFIMPDVPSLYTFGMDLSLDAGNAVLVNMSFDGTSIFIQSQQTDTTDPILLGWTMANPLSTGDDNAYPSCSMRVTGTAINAVAVWINFDGTNNVIMSASGSDTIIDPPTSVSASQSAIDFGVYQDYNNTITWTASSDPDIQQYNIYRNGVFFGATDPFTLTFTDHNQVQNGTVVYGVSAMTTSFRQSTIVSFTLFP